MRDEAQSDNQGQRDREVRCVCGESEEMTQPCERTVDRFRSEEDPVETNTVKRDKNARKKRCSAVVRRESDSFSNARPYADRHYPNTVQHTPEHKRPGRPVPEPTD